MNAHVIDLASRRPEVERTRCSCRPDRLCYPHQLANLTDLVTLWREANAGSLLVPVEELEALVLEVQHVVGGIVAECLPDERTAR